jgi:hypothetical protein
LGPAARASRTGLRIQTFQGWYMMIIINDENSKRDSRAVTYTHTHTHTHMGKAVSWSQSLSSRQVTCRGFAPSFTGDHRLCVCARVCICPQGQSHSLPFSRRV